MNEVFDTFNGMMAIGIGYVAVLMPVFILLVIFIYDAKNKKNRYDTLITISKNINNPEFFEEEPLSFKSRGSEGYSVNVNGEEYVISVNPLGDIEFADGVSVNTSATNAQPASTSNAQPINAQLGGNIFKVLCKVGDVIALDQTVLILEAMKMETEVKSPIAGTITSIDIKEGDAVTPGQLLLTVG